MHRNPAGIPARIAPAQDPAGFDSSPADARIAVTVGIGSGIGAIFRAPLGGAVLGAEILYHAPLLVTS